MEDQPNEKASIAQNILEWNWFRGHGRPRWICRRLAAMFNASGTAYAAPATNGSRAIETRFVFWFNGNGIPEKYWIPRQTGADFDFTPCLAPLERFRNDIHVVTGSG